MKPAIIRFVCCVFFVVSAAVDLAEKPEKPQINASKAGETPKAATGTSTGVGTESHDSELVAGSNLSRNKSLKKKLKEAGSLSGALSKSQERDRALDIKDSLPSKRMCPVMQHLENECVDMTAEQLCNKLLLFQAQSMFEGAGKTPSAENHPCTVFAQKIEYQNSKMNGNKVINEPKAFVSDITNTGKGAVRLDRCIRKCWAVWRAIVRGKTPNSNEYCACNELKDISLNIALDEEFVEKAMVARHNMLVLQSEQTRSRFVDHMENLKEEVEKFDQTKVLLGDYFSDRLEMLNSKEAKPKPGKASESVYVKKLMANFERTFQKGTEVLELMKTALSKFNEMDQEIREAKSLLNLFLDGFDFRYERGEADDFDLWNVVYTGKKWDLRLAVERVTSLPIHNFETSGRLNSGANYVQPREEAE